MNTQERISRIIFEGYEKSPDKTFYNTEIPAQIIAAELDAQAAKLKEAEGVLALWALFMSRWDAVGAHAHAPRELKDATFAKVEQADLAFHAALEPYLAWRKADRIARLQALMAANPGVKPWSSDEDNATTKIMLTSVSARLGRTFQSTLSKSARSSYQSVSRAIP